MRFTLIVVLAVLVAGLSGCGKKGKEALAEKMMEKAMQADGNKADVDLSRGTVRITTEEGNVVISSGADAKLPANMPSDVPVYKGAGVLQSMDRGDQGFFAMLTTTDPANKVTEFFKKAMEEKGWHSESVYETPGHWMTSASKDGVVLQVTVAGGDEGKTMISLTGQPAN